MLPNAKLVGLAATIPIEAVPLPESATLCGLLLAESIKLKVAVRVPVDSGLKRIVTVQLAWAARLDPQVLLEMLKSPAFVPEIAMLLIVMEVASPFDSIAACDALVTPTAVLAKESVVGLAVTLPDAAVPVPESVTV